MPTDIQKFERECLEAHNNFRAQHGCPPLKLNRTLSAQSREWAENLAKRKTMENSSGHNFGENLYMAEGIHVDGARPVKAWYDEIEDYDFEAAKFVQGAGHFTQLIWKSTHDLGVGVATNDKLTLVVTCYFPPGNVHGKFKENVPPRIDQENNKPSFSEDNTSIGSQLLGGTINIVLPNTLMSSTRNSKDFYDKYRSHELTIPIEMVSTATSPRVSINKELPRSTAQIVLKISNDRLEQSKYAAAETSNVTKNLDTNRTERNSITIKDMHYLPPPSFETPKPVRRTSSSGRTMLYRTASDIVLGSNEPRERQPVQRQESRSSKERKMAYKTETTRQEQSRMMPPPKPPLIKTARQERRSFQEYSLVHKSTSTDEFGRQEQPSVLYRTFSNIIIGSPEQHMPQSYTANNRIDTTRQDSISSKELDMSPENLDNTLVPRSYKNRDIVYRSTSSPETSRQKQTSANDSSFLYRTISNIVLDSPEQNIPQSYPANIRPTFARQNPISPKKRDMLNVSDPRTKISGQEQNRQMTTSTTFVAKSTRQEPRLNKDHDVVQRSTSAAEAERQERISANERKFLYRTVSNIVVSNQEPSTRQPIGRQDSISSKERDMSHATEITRQEQNIEMRDKKTLISQDLRQEPVPVVSSQEPSTREPIRRQDSISSKERGMSHATEITRQEQNKEMRDKKTLISQDLKQEPVPAVSNQEPSTRQPIRRQDSISSKERDISHATEITRQDQNREIIDKKALISQDIRQEPVPSKGSEVVNKISSVHETERQQRTSANERKYIYKKSSNMDVQSEEQTTRQRLRRQDSVSPRERDLANKTETTFLRSQTVKQEPGPSKVPNMVQKAFPAHPTERQANVNNKDRLESQEQTSQEQKYNLTKAEDMPPHVTALRNEIARQVKNKELPPKTTLSIETSCKNSIASKTPDVAHVMALRTEIANQEHCREMKAKQLPRAETGRQQPKTAKRQELESSKQRDMGHKRTAETVRQDSTVMGHKNVSQTKIPRLETVKHESRTFSNKNVSQTKIPRPESSRQQPKASTNKNVSQTKIPRPETVKRDSKTLTNIDVSYTKTSKTKVGGMESKTTPIIEPQRWEEEPTTSARSAETKSYGPTTQTGSSTERLRKIYEFSHADKLFHHECLLAHNCYRAKHGSPPLQLCEQLTLYATRWAQELANMDKLLYSPTEDLGENIYVAAGIRITGHTPVKAWYNEVEDYDFKKGEFTPYTGHFTQVIWKDTRELGVGVIKNEKCCIVVASYFPPGNEAGQFKDNVLPSRGCICDTEQNNNNSSSNKSSSNNSSCDNSSSDNSSNSPGSSNRLFHLGLLVTAMAAAAGGWIIYNRPFLN